MKKTLNSKAIEFINFPSILHDPVGRSSFPSNINNFDNFNVPTVFNTLGKPIHSRIFHFNKFVSNLDIDRFLQDNNILPCNYEGCEFIDQHHKHILNDNLKIIKNNKLRRLLTKGPEHRESKTTSFEKAKFDIIADLKEYAQDKNLSGEWKSNIIQKHDSRTQVYPYKKSS